MGLSDTYMRQWINRIGSDNCRGHAIIWTNAEISLHKTMGTFFSEIVIAILVFSFQKNAFENVVRKSAAILSRSRCVNLTFNASRFA